MAYDAARMHELSWALAMKKGFNANIVAALMRLCSELNLPTQEVLEVGIKGGRDALIVELCERGQDVGITLRQIAGCFDMYHSNVSTSLIKRGRA